jgi:hypothetical protein
LFLAAEQDDKPSLAYITCIPLEKCQTVSFAYMTHALGKIVLFPAVYDGRRQQIDAAPFGGRTRSSTDGAGHLKDAVRFIVKKQHHASFIIYHKSWIKIHVVGQEEKQKNTGRVHGLDIMFEGGAKGCVRHPCAGAIASDAWCRRVSLPT